jgi:hypothetical protein
MEVERLKEGVANMRCTCGLWPILTTTAGASSARGETARSGKREIILALLEV